MLLTIVCATVYGISDEFHQWFVPGRTADVHDVMADAIGATRGRGGSLGYTQGNRPPNAAIMTL